MAVKVLVSAYVGFHNFGDDLIFEQLVKYLKSKGAYISAFSANPKETARDYGVSAFKFNSLPVVIKQILKCDILFSGGGSLLQNQTSDKSMLYYLFIIFLAKLFGKKVVIFAQGLEGIRGSWQEFISKIILKMCDFITVRDNFSQIRLRKWGIKSYLVCDPFYDFDMPEYKPDGSIGVQVRESRNLSPMFLSNFAKSLVTTYPKRKIFIYIFQEADETPAVTLMMHIKRFDKDANVEMVASLTNHEIIDDFARLEYLFAMRYHACLLGLKYGIKVLPITYDFKIISLVNEYKLNCIDCSVDQDLTSVLKNAKAVECVKRNFEWDVFDFLFFERRKY